MRSRSNFVDGIPRDTVNANADYVIAIGSKKCCSVAGNGLNPARSAEGKPTRVIFISRYLASLPNLQPMESTKASCCLRLSAQGSV
jgi:hypothetical protein